MSFAQYGASREKAAKRLEDARFRLSGGRAAAREKAEALRAVFGARKDAGLPEAGSAEACCGEESEKFL